MIRICHLTSAHKPFDTRIFLKECQSLAKAGYEVILVAQHHREETVEGVRILPVERKSKSRLTRVLFFTWRIFFKALTTRSKVYHFHDPELIPMAILLRLFGKKVIFDIHENIARQLKTKSYLPLRRLISRLYSFIDWLSAKAFFIILAESSYQSIYQNRTSRYEVVLNMPDLDYLKPFQNRNRAIKKTLELFYVGGVTFERGIGTIIEAMRLLKHQGVDVKYHCVGPYEDSVMAKIRSIPAFEEVEEDIIFYGPRRLDMALEVSRSCHIGLAVLLPIENYLESYSTKIFEYMAIGLPVITSDFTLYRDVIDRHSCGYCINPEDPAQLANQIFKFTKQPTQISEMGMRGILAVQTAYNWAAEEKKLIEVYRRLTR